MGECCLCGKYATPDYCYGDTYYCQSCIEKCIPIFDYFKVEMKDLKRKQYDRIRSLYIVNQLDIPVRIANELKELLE